jgi:hypothetical protein
LMNFINFLLVIGLAYILRIVYCPLVSNIWYEERLVSGSKPLPRYRHTSTVVGKTLFIFGGVDKNQRR